LLVCNWPHSVGQNHFFVKMLFNRDSSIQNASRRFCTVCKSENSVPCQLSRRPSGCPTIQSIICPDDENIPSEPSFVSRSFESAPACFRPDVSAARLDDSQCSTSFRISFQNTVMGISLQPSGRRGIPSGCPTVQSIIRPDNENISSGPSSVSRSFESTLACFRPDVSAARPDDSLCSTSFRISFQNTVMGRSLQPPGRRGFLSGRAHP
jgi:hypothetical protein